MIRSNHSDISVNCSTNDCSKDPGGITRLLEPGNRLALNRSEWKQSESRNRKLTVIEAPIRWSIRAQLRGAPSRRLRASFASRHQQRRRIGRHTRRLRCYQSAINQFALLALACLATSLFTPNFVSILVVFSEHEPEEKKAYSHTFK